MPTYTRSSVRKQTLGKKRLLTSKLPNSNNRSGRQSKDLRIVYITTPSLEDQVV